MPKPFADIAAVANPNKPWIQDPADSRFFFIKLKRPWNPTEKYLEKNPSTGQQQALAFDPSFLNKRQQGTAIAEDAIGMSPDGLTLWRFSSDSAPTLSVNDIGYDEGGSAKLTGTPFGTPGSYDNNPSSTFQAVFDGNTSTYFDAAQPDGNVCGIDFGTIQSIKLIRYFPRSGTSHRMTNGQFQISDDNLNWTTIHTVSFGPSEWTEIPVDVRCRFCRYASPPGSYGNVAEIEFYS